MPRNAKVDTLLGRTVRFTFEDGPTAGTTYEHVFDKDGSIGFRDAGDAKAKFSRAREGTVARIGDGLFVVSYRSKEGYTLTALLNMGTGQLVGFASNNEMWMQQKGKFELVD
jgi:hypothetical protein